MSPALRKFIRMLAQIEVEKYLDELRCLNERAEKESRHKLAFSPRSPDCSSNTEFANGEANACTDVGHANKSRNEGENYE